MRATNMGIAVKTNMGRTKTGIFSPNHTTVVMRTYRSARNAAGESSIGQSWSTLVSRRFSADTSGPKDSGKDTPPAALMALACAICSSLSPLSIMRTTSGTVRVSECFAAPLHDSPGSAWSVRKKRREAHPRRGTSGALQNLAMWRAGAGSRALPGSRAGNPERLRFWHSLLPGLPSTGTPSVPSIGTQGCHLPAGRVRQGNTEQAA
mmetsp:Transcript_56050/g.166729  ORF Transcript_56050/g.166729 Transcript_56050/m.166729 type:complete len:207 (+) Transcript_56050:635-1255(+)